MLTLLEFITKALAWLQTAISPFVAGIIAGILIYSNKKDVYGLMIAIGIVIIGAITGVIWATRVWKRKGTVEYMSKLIATPELDDVKEISNNSK